MKYLQAVVVFVGAEAIGLIVFPVLSRRLGPDRARGWDTRAILKGILERLVLYTALLHGFPQMLIALGAMKLGTRLHHEGENDISNTYFLVGNLLSFFLAIVAVIVTREIWAP